MGMKILVAGATGYLGGYILKELKKNGYFVRALTRRKDGLTGLESMVDEVFVGDACHPGQIEGACQDMDVVFSSLGITRQKDGLTYQQVDYQANRNLLSEAISKKVAKFVYVSVFNAQKLGHLQIVRAKEQFVNELKSSSLDYVIIRPNGFFSDMAEFFEMAKKGRVWLFGRGEFLGNPIHGQDLAEACVDCLEQSRSEIDIGGPQVLSQNQIVNIISEVLETEVKVSYIPLWVNKILLKLMRRFTSVKTYGPIEFFLTVLSMDMVAPEFGRLTLKEFYSELKEAL